jgi:exopolysaccharide biosynthesis polyprenyl glycosylphosphotransferase
MNVVNLMTAELDSSSLPNTMIEERWRPHKRLLVLTDTSAAAAASLVTLAVQIGGSDVAHLHGVPMRLAVAAVTPLWVLAMWLCGGYGRHAVIFGSEPYRRLLTAASSLFALVAVSDLLVDSTQLFRREVIAVVLAAIFTPLFRRLSMRLPSRLRAGRHTAHRGLLVGHAKSIDHFLAQQQPGDLARLHVAATYAIDGAEDPKRTMLSAPAHSGLDAVPEMVRRTGCDMVIALGSPELDGAALRRLSWRLRELGVDLALAPILATVASDRIAVGSVGGLPLLHIRAPMVSGPWRMIKELLERSVAAILLLLFSPVMLVVAVLVRSTSPGPALFRQQRVGFNGTEFTCFKFRTMVVNAEQLRAELEHLNEKHDGLLFKIRKDPRLTRVGAVLRRYSLDELPQLFNVVGGSMALIGPRPPLPAEAAQYTEEVWRRLYVKPGLTGLWQVSGRSSLSWAESVRLDLNYVENWSPGLDANILLRTTTAVVRGTGAF